MDYLIHNFSPNSLSSFFKSQISSFVPKTELFQDSITGSDKSHFSHLIKHGETSLNDDNELLVFSCKYNGQLSERSSKKKQFDIAKNLLKEDFKDGAIFVFYDDDGKFRFSFIRKNWGEKGDKRYSSWNRYTYFVNPEDTNKTFKERVGKCKFSGLDDIQEAFSVEKLTKEFYNDLFRWYQWALSEEIGITFPNNTNIVEDDRLKLEERIIRLITRLLFVWFIKQKHLVPEKLFKIEELLGVIKNFDPYSKTDGSYYNAILQNLFFATLNKAVNERDFARLQNSRDIKTLYRYEEMFNIPKEEVLNLFSPIPFLNGGLFECLDKEEKTDGVKYALDGFSRNSEKLKGHYKHRAFVPNCVFFDEKNGLIPLLQRYNFTVEENAPNEVQVALDPELLGNVFENLLGVFNPETKETARKQSGSFYTPREIVSYMVDESLITYLTAVFPFLKEDIIRQLFEQEQLPDELANDHTLCENVSKALRKVKILDPACGSGAFPMGILNKMVEVLQKLDCNEEKTIYEQKLHLIEQCIYGVDIQTIAAQISKLRFFISLICEQKSMDPSKFDENYGVLTLPNLETKFVAANTLIGIKRKPAQQNLFEDPQIEITKQKLLSIRKEHFYAKTAYAKQKLREQDAELRDKLFTLLRDNGDFAPEDAIQFSKWNPYDQNSSSPFFDTEWMFGQPDGFDIVIGNPPYVQLQADSGKLAKMYQNCGYKTFARTGDIYSLFYERGWQLLKQGGKLCFITSNKWMRAGYGGNTRLFFAENTNPILLIDFAGQKIFESATVDTNILLFEKAKNEGQTKTCLVKEKVLNNLSVFVRQQVTVCRFDSDASWVILSDIERRIKEKIERIGTPLKNWNIDINYGIKTGLNEAFIISGDKRRQLIELDPKSEEIIRPILRGRDIKRYTYEYADLWLIATFPSLKIEIEHYPAVKQHLLNFGYDRLKQTGEQGARKKTNNKWFETQDSISYWEDFNRQKIIYPEITKFLNFYLDNDGFYSNNKCFILSGDHLSFLVAFLNSSLFKFCYKENFPELLGGTRELRKIFLEQLSILRVSDTVNEEFSILISKLQELKNKFLPTITIELEIDEKIFDLYSLTKDEREIVGFIEIQ